MPFKTAKELDDIRQDLHDTVWPLITDPEGKIWSLKGGSDKEKTGLVYKGSHPKIGTTWKLEAIIDISPDEYFKHFVVNGEIIGWVPHVKKYDFLERSESGDDDWTVTYTETSSIMTVSGRDWVSLNFHKLLEDGSHYCTTIATQHPNAPKTSLVRGEYLPSSTVLRPVKDNPYRCEIIWVNNASMNGFLPRSLINMVMSSFTLEFATALIAQARKMAEARKK